MDASKLMNVLDDLNRADEDYIKKLLQELIANITSNQMDKITKTVQELILQINLPTINKYNQSDFEILVKIGAIEYFGNNGIQTLNLILSENSYNIKKTTENLQLYLNNRQKFSERINKTLTGLSELNIKIHHPIKNTYEVGLLMPSTYTHKKIITVTKELNRWDKIFKTIKEITGETPQDTQLSFISNGSLQFFVNNAPEVAACLAVAIERVIKVYKNIVEIRIARQKLKELGVNLADQKAIEKQEKEIATTEFDKISNDIIKEFATKNIDAGRVNELKIAMHGHITYIAKCIDGGMTIEINPPLITQPKIINTKETPENKAEIKRAKTDYDKALKQADLVKKSMEAIKTISETGIDITKLITGFDKDDDSEESA